MRQKYLPLLLIFDLSKRQTTYISKRWRQALDIWHFITPAEEKKDTTLHYLT
jgi:ubiquinone biosynthesis protein Coq4